MLKDAKTNGDPSREKFFQDLFNVLNEDFSEVYFEWFDLRKGSISERANGGHKNWAYHPMKRNGQPRMSDYIIKIMRASLGGDFRTKY